jgi:molybdopterin molybdotransferase
LEALAAESVELGAAAGRVLARPFTAPHDLPGFTRATMDGFAVRGKDTFGAGETEPAYLRLAGEVRMGTEPDFRLGPGQCARIMTGGMLPAGADAVVMVEHTRELAGGEVEIARSAAPGANLLGPADDAARGRELLPAGHRLRPQDLGLLAGLGRERVEVRRRPRVGVISTGDEVVPVGAEPGPGQVRDVNTTTLAAQVRQAGGEPLALGLAPDRPEELARLVERSLAEADLTLLSGGSSVGARDLTADIFTSFAGAELLVHGVSVSPGKPFIWVRTPAGHLLGLPGQVASCLVAFHLLVEPVLEAMLGRPALPFARFGRRPAVLARNLASAQGREDYVRVRLEPGENGGPERAAPVLGKSGLIRTLVQGHGLVRIPLEDEGLEAGAAVEVLTFPA